MGNQLLKGYAIQGEPISCTGCEKMWRMYQGIRRSTSQLATIFVIQKRSLNKSQREQIIKFAKKQVMNLARIRHPGVLAISQTLIEDEQILAYATEPVLGNLTTLFRQNKLRDIIANQIQLRLNLFPLIDTILFLHDNVKTVHLGLNFDNIYITKQGKWKISGFSNSQIYIAQNLQEINDYKCADLGYSAPELVLHKKFENKSDSYSLGVVILNLLLILCDQFSEKTFPSISEYQQSYEKLLIGKVNNSKLQKTENYKQLKVLFKSMFSRHPDKRLCLKELVNSKWLNDKFVLTVKYLQNITNYDNKQQIQFLKGLIGIIDQFQTRILLKKVLPLLMDLLKFKHLIPSIIYISIQIAKSRIKIKNSDFMEHIWPHLKKVAMGKEITAYSLFMIVNNMALLEKIVSLEQLTEAIIPLYIKCFDCPPKLKILALHQTDYILNKMDYQFVKAKFLPKILSCIKDNHIQIHKKGLIALKKSIKIIDVQTITSQILPSLQHNRRAGSDPFINAIILSIYGQLARSLPTETLSSKLIPIILPYLTDPSVSSHDFYNYKAALMEMLAKIESERKKLWSGSQQENVPKFTQSDFDFTEQQVKVQEKQSFVGTGNYNFLSNYQIRQDQQSKTQSSPQGQFSGMFQQQMNFKSPSSPVKSIQQTKNLSFTTYDPFSIQFEKNQVNQYVQQSYSRTSATNNQIGPTFKGPADKTFTNHKSNQYNAGHNMQDNASDPWSALDNINISKTQCNPKGPDNKYSQNVVLNSNWMQLDHNVLLENNKNNYQIPKASFNPNYNDPFSEMSKPSHYQPQTYLNLDTHATMSTNSSTLAGSNSYDFQNYYDFGGMASNKDEIGLKKKQEGTGNEFDLL